MDNSKLLSEHITLTEHLSALLDDEAGSFEQRRVLNELVSDASLRQKLSGYALIGESMRSEDMQSMPVAGSDFLSAIHDKIQDEPDYHHVELESQHAPSSNVKSKNAWLRPLGGFAVAASVAAVAVLGFQNYQLQNNLGALQTLATAQTSSVSANNKPKTQLSAAEMDSAKVVSAADMVAAKDAGRKSGADNESDVYQQADANTRSYLKRYVDSHMQYASRALLPSVRVIAYADY